MVSGESASHQPLLELMSSNGRPKYLYSDFSIRIDDFNSKNGAKHSPLTEKFKKSENFQVRVK